ncbi:MAG: hypothetical protein JXA58_08690 [Dehalococcoidia bacterium]|nr:hypothetical protein [Dehalococcoidia bacterium]
MCVRVFITGCARSGTTLLNRLFYAFDELFVIDTEMSLDRFVTTVPAARGMVAKRTPQTILSVPLPAAELRRQATIIKANGIRIVNVIRDGRDVVHLHPAGPRVNVNRWIGCMLQAQRFQEYVTLEVRYEDLVVAPNDVQKTIAQVLGLRMRYSFSAYPDFVRQEVFEVDDYRPFAQYRRRPIDQASVGHSESEYRVLCRDDAERALFERVLRKLKYLPTDGGAGWTREELRQDQCLFESMSAEMGYGCA